MEKNDQVQNSSKLDDINFDNLIENKDVPIDFDKFEEELMNENEEPSWLNKNDRKKYLNDRKKYLKKERVTLLSESFKKKAFILSIILYILSLVGLLFDNYYSNIPFYISIAICVLLNIFHSKYGKGLIIFYVLSFIMFGLFFARFIFYG